MRLHRFPAAGCGAAALALACAVPLAAGAASKPAAPAVHEKFTPLPCPKRPASTRQIEGCAEHTVLAADKTIDALNKKVFARLREGGRATFIKTNADWVTYRAAACTTEASIYSGASIQPVAYANCLVSIDSSHVTELRKMLVALSPAA
jgi:uncharacterized protein YecT (DUF1311 family)